MAFVPVKQFEEKNGEFLVNELGMDQNAYLMKVGETHSAIYPEGFFQTSNGKLPVFYVKADGTKEAIVKLTWQRGDVDDEGKLCYQNSILVTYVKANGFKVEHAAPVKSLEEMEEAAAP